RLLAAHSSTKLKWDASSSRYTLGDGTVIAETPAVLYQRAIWKPAIPKIEASVTFERKSANEVAVEVRVDLSKGASFPKSRVRILAKDGLTELHVISMEALNAPANSTMGAVSGASL